ncbi:hypothetical protein RJ639_030579 [Escallonia herrerae]|uniref:Glycosyltransferases n=1 Tax=Escallonia herrerae TaxID=1293975 RepID=A0AA89BEQ9_9ASTE|nr:hypothetical protein RJ639_030579 [Escallonia herrerae]
MEPVAIFRACRAMQAKVEASLVKDFSSRQVFYMWIDDGEVQTTAGVLSDNTSFFRSCLVFSYRLWWLMLSKLDVTGTLPTNHDESLAFKTLERSRKKVQLWKKAIVHFLLCFVMGFFTGFAPTGRSSIFSSRAIALNRSETSPQPVEAFHEAKPQQHANFNRSLSDETRVEEPKWSNSESERADIFEEEEEEEELAPRRLVIIVTPTSARDHVRGVKLRRLANTLKLVPPPLLWVVVEAHSESSEVSEILRKTGVMYRHLVFKENFTEIEVEMDHQRNVALNHIEHHRLSGIVHFAGLSNVYDLSFFEEIRAIE